MSYNIIPLTSDPDQKFSCNVPVNGSNISLGFRIRYNTEAFYWYMSVSDSKGNILVDAVPLVTGVNLIEPYLGIGIARLAKTGTAAGDRPDDTNLGTEYVLVWGDSI